MNPSPGTPTLPKNSNSEIVNLPPPPPASPSSTKIINRQRNWYQNYRGFQKP